MVSKKREFKPGFRLSTLDILILVVSAVAAISLWGVSSKFSTVIVFVVLHFFYFCNITRMSRVPELIWAAGFVLIVGLGVHNDILSLSLAFLICLSLTCLLTILEIRKPSYHGLFWSKLNPNLQQWFESSSQN